MMTKISNFLSPILIGCMIIGIFSNIIYPNNPFASILIVLIVGLVILLQRRRLKVKLSKFKARAKTLTKLGMVLIIVIQFAIITYFKASVYHDPFRVLYQADLLSHHSFNWDYSTYFYYCPNNICLTYILASWLKFMQFFGVSSNWAVHILCILTIDLFIVLMIDISHELTSDPLAPLMVVVFFLVTPLAYTYMLQVFYSDILLLIAVSGTLLAFLKWDNSSVLKKVGISISIFMCGLLGMLIKPSFIVMGIAVILVSLLFLIFKKKIKLVIPCIFLFCGMTVTPIIEQQIVNEVHFSNKSEYKLPVSSWIYMGLNQKTCGTYSESDMNQIKNIPSSKRKSETFHLIQHRMTKMNPIGLLSQWVNKIEICENVGTVQGAYMSGNYKAPSWFLYFQDFLSNVSSIVFRSIIILMMLKIIKKMYYQKVLSAWWEIFVQLALLGFIAFYGIVWETECRYGLVLIPLYMFLLLLPASNKINRVKVEDTPHTGQIIFIGLILEFLILNLFTQNISKNIENFSGVVNSQNSQLSQKYNAKNYKIQAGTQLNEQVDLKRNANHFAMIVPENSKVQIELVNKTTLKKYRLIRRKDVATYNGKIPAGTFQIKVINPTKGSQKCTIVNPKSYHLSNYKVNGYSKIHNGYFVYSFENR